MQAELGRSQFSELSRDSSVDSVEQVLGRFTHVCPKINPRDSFRVLGVFCETLDFERLPFIRPSLCSSRDRQALASDVHGCRRNILLVRFPCLENFEFVIRGLTGASTAVEEARSAGCQRVESQPASLSPPESVTEFTERHRTHVVYPFCSHNQDRGD